MIILKTLKEIFLRILAYFPQVRIYISKKNKQFLYLTWYIKSSNKLKNEKNIKINNIIKDNKNHYFFGYYDKCPWDSTQRYVLFLKVPFANRMPKKDEEAEIGFIDLKKDNELNIVAKTKAWNWQQGCMLQWFGGKTFSKIIFNDYRNEKYISIIYDIFKGFKKEIPLPIYSISNDYKHALTLNFSRLHFASPGYGYIAEEYKNKNISIPEGDGIWHIDIDSLNYQLIIPFSKIIQYSSREEFKDSYHWINHITFNPSGNRFIFLHRWRFKGNRFTRMFTADLNGDNLYCVIDYGMVSHFTWLDDIQILVWAYHPQSGNKFYIFKDKSNYMEVFGENVLNEDGHPSFSPDNKWLLTDTYPNNGRRQKLLLYNTNTQEIKDLGNYFSPFKFYGPLRCDLHPRWSKDGKYICFDSAHEGIRSMYTIDLNNMLG